MRLNDKRLALLDRLRHLSLSEFTVSELEHLQYLVDPLAAYSDTSKLEDALVVLEAFLEVRE